MHQLGFWHEHERDDRDDYIKINWFASYPGVKKLTCPKQMCTEFKKYPYDKGLYYNLYCTTSPNKHIQSNLV